MGRIVIGPAALEKQIDNMFEEIDAIMSTLPGKIDRVSDATLKEEFRHWFGTNFDGSGQYSDNDIWRNMYDHFDKTSEATSFYERFMIPCNLHSLVLIIKYPAVYERLKLQGVIK